MLDQAALKATRLYMELTPEEVKILKELIETQNPDPSDQRYNNKRIKNALVFYIRRVLLPSRNSLLMRIVKGTLRKIATSIDTGCRVFILVAISESAYSRDLFSRIIRCEVGYTGIVSEKDHQVAAENKLKPLNHFERWFARDLIENERTKRRKAYFDYLRQKLSSALRDKI